MRKAIVSPRKPIKKAGTPPKIAPEKKQKAYVNVILLLGVTSIDRKLTTTQMATKSAVTAIFFAADRDRKNLLNIKKPPKVRRSAEKGCATRRD